VGTLRFAHPTNCAHVVGICFRLGRGGAGEESSEASSVAGAVIIGEAIIDSVEIFTRSSFSQNGARLVHLIPLQPRLRPARRLGLFRHFAKPRVGFVSPNGIRRSACGIRGVIAAWHLDRCVQIRREGADRAALSAQIFRFVSFAVRSPRG
jgi:hypothetical protein